MNTTTAPITIEDDIDDVECHAVTCNCDECVDGLVLELTEDRVA